MLEANSFETGLQVYRFGRNEIRLVISDVTMPGRSGHELVAELRGDQPSLPIVMLAAYEEPGVAREAAPRTRRPRLYASRLPCS